MATSFKRSLAGTSALSAPKPAASYCKPHFCQRLLDTHGQVWVSLLWDHCSWVKSLSPGSWGAQGSICALQSLFLQSCVSSGSSVVGLTATSSERLCHTQVCCTQSPCPCGRTLLTRTSTGDTQTQFCLSLGGISGSWCSQGFFLSPPSISGGYGV